MNSTLGSVVPLAMFNFQVSKPTDLFNVVLLVFLLSDVFKLLVFRPPPCSSCERSEPT